VLRFTGAKRILWGLAALSLSAIAVTARQQLGPDPAPLADAEPAIPTAPPIPALEIPAPESLLLELVEPPIALTRAGLATATPIEALPPRAPASLTVAQPIRATVPPPAMTAVRDREPQASATDRTTPRSGAESRESTVEPRTSPGIETRWTLMWSNVRQRPDNDAPILRVLRPGTAVQGVPGNWGWWTIRLGRDSVGYIAGDLLVATPPPNPPPRR
jgi:hypothetical protein